MPLQDANPTPSFGGFGLKGAQGTFDAGREEWRSWLAIHRLPASLSPRGVSQFLERVETARARLGQADAMRRRICAIRVDIQQFRDLVQPVDARYGGGINDVPEQQLAIVADRLIKRYEVADRAKDLREVNKQAAASYDAQVNEYRQRLTSLNSAMNALIRAGGASDAEDLRRRAAQHNRRLELERERRDRRTRLAQIAGPNGTADDLLDALSRTDIEAIQDETERVAEEMDGIEELRSRLDEESSILRSRKAALTEELQVQAEEWSKYTLAAALLNKAREKYERERQPAVIRYAESYFKTVTAGRYDRLNAGIGEHTITVMDADGSTKGPEQLSRGTREQLYLALRFGLVKVLGEHMERLPVIVDDVLVNFDPDRARHAAEAFVELSETNQVLVFTCHPTVVELFERVSPGVHVVDLDGSVGSPIAVQPRLT